MHHRAGSTARAIACILGASIVLNICIAQPTAAAPARETPLPPANVQTDSVEIPRPGGTNLPAKIWFLDPRNTSTQDRLATRTNLIVFSHGTLGSWAENADTAPALAQP